MYSCIAVISTYYIKKYIYDESCEIRGELVNCAIRLRRKFKNCGEKKMLTVRDFLLLIGGVI
jgi:hypothetical protein